MSFRDFVRQRRAQEEAGRLAGPAAEDDPPSAPSEAPARNSEAPVDLALEEEEEEEEEADEDATEPDRVEGATSITATPIAESSEVETGEAPPVEPLATPVETTRTTAARLEALRTGRRLRRDSVTTEEPPPDVSAAEPREPSVASDPSSTPAPAPVAAEPIDTAAEPTAKPGLSATTAAKLEAMRLKRGRRRGRAAGDAAPPSTATSKAPPPPAPPPATTTTTS